LRINQATNERHEFFFDEPRLSKRELFERKEGEKLSPGREKIGRGRKKRF